MELDPSDPSLAEEVPADEEPDAPPQFPYWAAAPDIEIGEKLAARVTSSDLGRLVGDVAARYSRAYQYYYGITPYGVHATSQVLRGGDQGELATVRVNHSRSLVNTLLNLIVAPKIVWTPKATNVDYDSVRECDLAAAILEYYWTESDVAKFAVRALEEALVFSEGFVLLEWHDDAGEDYAPDGKGMLRSGDVCFSNVSAMNVIRDPSKSSWEALDWVIVRKYVNKYDLIARYPDMAGEIFSVSDDRAKFGDIANSSLVDSDDVACFYFYHRRSAALPDGRETLFLSNKAVLQDGALSYETIPLYRVSAGEITGTPFGYTPYLDILGIQELFDSLQTAVASNQSTLATQCIAMEAGSEVSFDDVAGGMRAITYPNLGKPPEVLQLLKTPAEVFTHLGNLKKDMELIFGTSSTVRGDPPSGDMSGSALALLQSQSLQQASTIQGNYLRFVAHLGDGLIKTVQKRASIPKKIAITGKTSAFLVTETEYSAQDLTRIKRVQVEIGNPLAQTAAGRAEMAKELIQMGFVKTAEQYEQVLTTGKIQPLTGALHNQLLLIKSENEALANGEMPPCLVLDDHMLHAREHASVLANPEARRNPAVIQAVLAHIDEHQRLYFSASPATLIMAGLPPPPMIGPPGMGMGPPGMGSPPDGAPPNGGGPGPDGNAPPPKPPGDLAPPELRKAKPPRNPATGMKWNPIDGGGAVPTQTP